jgi:hypothetical protein
MIAGLVVDVIVGTEYSFADAYLNLNIDRPIPTLTEREATIAVAVDNIYNPGPRMATMTSYVFRVCLHPNPPLGFEPEEEVWRDIEIDGSHTLADFHEAIFEAFDRWDSHAYEFITRDEDGIALRSYVHPGLYDGGLSWQPMDDEEIDRFIDRAAPDDASEATKERFRDLQLNPPPEGNAADTTVAELDPEELGALSYTFDMGDNWEHYIELQETREGSLDGDSAVADEQGDAPSQYRDLDDE